jgi:hypothetical protein
VSECESKKAEHERRCDTLSTSLEENLQVGHLLNSLSFRERSKLHELVKTVVENGSIDQFKCYYFSYVIIIPTNNSAMLVLRSKYFDRYKVDVARSSGQGLVTFLNLLIHQITKIVCYSDHRQSQRPTAKREKVDRRLQKSACSAFLSGSTDLI